MNNEKLKPSKVFLNGIITENPTFRLVLGTCPTLAVTTSAINGLGMGLAATFVLLCSNVLISLLRNIIPDKVRIPAYITIIATFVTVIDMLLAKFVPGLYESLGLFIPLIVVNCIILGRAEAFASKHPVGLSALDGLGMGLGFTCSLTLLGIIREFIGAGSFFGMEIPWLSQFKMIIFILPAGGFMTFGLVMALINYIDGKNKAKKKLALESAAASETAALIEANVALEETKAEPVVDAKPSVAESKTEPVKPTVAEAKAEIVAEVEPEGEEPKEDK